MIRETPVKKGSSIMIKEEILISGVLDDDFDLSQSNMSLSYIKGTADKSFMK